MSNPMMRRASPTFPGVPTLEPYARTENENVIIVPAKLSHYSTNKNNNVLKRGSVKQAVCDYASPSGSSRNGFLRGQTPVSFRNAADAANIARTITAVARAGAKRLVDSCTREVVVHRRTFLPVGGEEYISGWGKHSTQKTTACRSGVSGPCLLQPQVPYIPVGCFFT